MDRLFEISINIYTVLIAVNVNMLVDVIKPYLSDTSGKAIKPLLYPMIFIVSVAQVFIMRYVFNVQVPTDPAQWLTVAIVSVVLYDIGGYNKLKSTAKALYDTVVEKLLRIIGK